MKPPPFFSVVIPTYNCAGFLRKALTSVLSQTYQDFEIIVVDNSSTDNTDSVLKSFSKGKLNAIKVKNNGIIARSRNVGINKAKGQWIAFLDSDDIWHESKLEEVHKAIIQNTDAILFCHDEWKVVNGDKKNRLRYGPAVNNMYEKLLFIGNRVSTSAVCVRKNIAIDSGGFSEKKEFVTSEDYEYWIRLAQVGKFYFINEALGEYHIHGQNTSRNYKNHISAGIAVKEYHLGLWSTKFPNRKNTINYGRARMWAVASVSFIKVNKFDSASKCALKAIGFSPFYWKAWVALFLVLFRIRIN